MAGSHLKNGCTLEKQAVSGTPFGVGNVWESAPPAAAAGRTERAFFSPKNDPEKFYITRALVPGFTIENMGKTLAKRAKILPYVQKDKFGKKRPKKGRKRARSLVAYMTDHEKDRFFKAVDSVRDRAIFRLLYHHGLRASEIGKLDYADYHQGPKADFDRINIHRLKGSISGEAAMVPAAALALRVWVRKRGFKDPHGPLFTSQKGGRLTRQRIWQLMRKYCALAGIPIEKAHPHTWKHTCATHLVSNQRESIIDVQTHLGHASIKNTMIYAQLSSEANAARAKRLREWK